MTTRHDTLLARINELVRDLETDELAVVVEMLSQPIPTPEERHFPECASCGMPIPQKTRSWAKTCNTACEIELELQTHGDDDAVCPF